MLNAKGKQEELYFVSLFLQFGSQPVFWFGISQTSYVIERISSFFNCFEFVLVSIQFFINEFEENPPETGGSAVGWGVLFLNKQTNKVPAHTSIMAFLLLANFYFVLEYFSYYDYVYCKFNNKAWGSLLQIYRVFTAEGHQFTCLSVTPSVC